MFCNWYKTNILQTKELISKMNKIVCICVCIPYAGAFHWGCSVVEHMVWVQPQLCTYQLFGIEATGQKQSHKDDAHLLFNQTRVYVYKLKREHSPRVKVTVTPTSVYWGFPSSHKHSSNSSLLKERSDFIARLLCFPLRNSQVTWTAAPVTL